MKISITGNFRELSKFKDKIDRMPAALLTINQQLAEETIELIREGFETKTDPYGKPWALHSALTQQIRPGGKILEDNGHLKSGWHKRFATAHRFGVGNAREYAGWMQRGTGIYGPRKRAIVPKRGRLLRIPFKSGGGAIYRQSVAGSPARRMVPSSSRLPARWRKRYIATAQDVLTELFS